MPLAVLVWCVLSLIWSSTWLFIKLGLDDLPPVSFVPCGAPTVVREIASPSLPGEPDDKC